MGQWIKGSFFNTKNYFDNSGTCQKIIKSSIYKAQDNVSQGYKPNAGGNGVLYSWKNKPLAYYDVPTLNDMIFSKTLWEEMRSNPFIVAALENHCFWGEEQHRDDSEVKLPNVAIRVNDFHVDDDNMILGDIDLMDTPNGVIIYALAKTGAVGNSSRGFGDLWDINGGYIVDEKHPATGTTKVVETTYLPVDWDVVGFPAVPNCLGMYTDGSEQPMTAAVQDLEKGLREQITNSIVEAHEKDPFNEWLSAMYNSLQLADKKKTFPLASSVSKGFKKPFEAAKAFRR